MTNVHSIIKTVTITGLATSDSDPNKEYDLSYTDGEYSCTCPRFTHTSKECKHMRTFKKGLEDNGLI